MDKSPVGYLALVPHYVFYRAIVEDLAELDDGDSRAEVLGFIKPVGREEDRGAAILDKVKEVPPSHRVQANGWFIEVGKLGRSEKSESSTQLPFVASTQDACVFM